MGVPFITENEETFESTNYVGGFQFAEQVKDFDQVFEDACTALKESADGMNLRQHINKFIENADLVDNFKNDLLSGIREEQENRMQLAAMESGNDPAALAKADVGYFNTLYEQCSQIYDNTIEQLVKEAAVTGPLLPIKAIDLPICIKSHVRATFNAILKTKINQGPIIKKQIERTWVYDPKTGKRWEYPQVLFTEEWKEIYEAGKGIKMSDEKQTLPLFNFNLVDKLTDVDMPEREHMSIDTTIPVVYATVDGEEIPIRLRHPMTIDMHTGAWVGGKIDQTVKKADGTEVQIQDVLSGFTDYRTNITNVNSASGQITAVQFSGRLSNEHNERQVRTTWSRENRSWEIEDGFRADASYSLEELDEAHALAKMNLYQRSYNDLSRLLTDMEDNYGFDYLDEKFDEYDGAEFDLLDFSPFVTHRSFNCASAGITAALPSDYIANELKFLIDRYVTDIADDCKLEGLTFVLYGNPRYISLLNPHVNWKITSGQRVGGVKMNFNYGVMTSNGVHIEVVSAMKRDAKKHSTIRLVAIPTDELTITFEKYKYTTHIETDKTGDYHDPELRGGSKTYLMATSRYRCIDMQGIQGDISFVNTEEFIKIFGQ